MLPEPPPTAVALTTGSYDAVVHTESLQSDWERVMASIGEPASLLPPNPNPTKKVGARGACPPVVFTQEVVEIIERLDRRMFEEFHYERRTDYGFVLR